MTYAIIEIGGTQLRVEPGRFYDVNQLNADLDSNYTVDKVLLIHHENEIHVGQPYVSGAVVEGTIMSNLRGKKVLVYKMKPKKKTRKKRGHRQELTRFMINSIKVNGTELASVNSETKTEEVAVNS
jgi:large subunit ribosomal protein L21